MQPVIKRRDELEGELDNGMVSGARRLQPSLVVIEQAAGKVDSGAAGRGRRHKTPMLSLCGTAHRPHTKKIDLLFKVVLEYR